MVDEPIGVYRTHERMSPLYPGGFVDAIETREELQAVGEVALDLCIEGGGACDLALDQLPLFYVLGLQTAVGVDLNALFDVGLVDPEHPGFDLLQALLQPLLIAPLLFVVAMEGFHQDIAEDGGDLGGNLQMGQVREERVIGLIGPHAEGAFAVAMIVPDAVAVPGAATGAGQDVAGGRAQEVTAQGQFFPELVLLTGVQAAKAPLHALEKRAAH